MLDKILDLEPVKNDKESNIVVYENIEKTDKEIVVDNIKDLIETSIEAINELVSIAKVSQHPNVYNCLNEMLKTSSYLNKDLFKIVSEKEEKNNDQPKTINNNLFVGSTTELQKMLNKNNE